MRVVGFGATGNVGTSVLEALGATGEVDEIVGVARRKPRAAFPKTTFLAADITNADLVPIVQGADAVIDLTWLIQPGRDETVTRSVNVDGTARVLGATADANVPALIYASSVGTYSPGPKDRLVDESWPAEGIPTSFYSRHKVAVERLLDHFEREHPGVRVVRLRPGLIFKAEAATEIRRLFAGPFLPPIVLRNRIVPVVPDLPKLRFQAVHSRDVGDAYARWSTGRRAVRTTSRRSRSSAPGSSRRCCRRAGYRFPRPHFVSARPRPTAPVSRRPNPVGWTWRPRSRCSIPPGLAMTSAGHRRATPSIPWRS